MFKKRLHNIYNQARLYIEKNSSAILVVLYSVPLVDTFVMDKASDVLYFGTVILYMLVSRIMHRSSKSTFSYCLLLLSFMYVLYIFTGPSVMTENVSVWLVLFMATGVIQMWNE